MTSKRFVIFFPRVMKCKIDYDDGCPTLFSILNTPYFKTLKGQVIHYVIYILCSYLKKIKQKE